MAENDEYNLSKDDDYDPNTQRYCPEIGCDGIMRIPLMGNPIPWRSKCQKCGAVYEWSFDTNFGMYIDEVILKDKVI